jgi:hypothetical protein
MIGLRSTSIFFLITSIFAQTFGFINVFYKFPLIITFVIPFLTSFSKREFDHSIETFVFHFISIIGSDGLPDGNAGCSGTSNDSYYEVDPSSPAVNSRHPTGFTFLDNPSIVARQPDHRFTLIDHNSWMVEDIHWTTEVLEMLVPDRADRDRLPGRVILDIGMLGIVSMCCALCASRKPAVICCGSPAPNVNQDCLELIHS